MIVVSDTSPLRALSAIGHLSLVPDLLGKAIIPPAVAGELSVRVPGLPDLELALLPFIEVRAPKDTRRVQWLQTRLNAGESEAIVLALEMGISTVLIDELIGRDVASASGLKPLGVLGLLVRAKAEGRVPAVGPLVAELKDKIDFRVSPRLEAAVLKAAGET